MVIRDLLQDGKARTIHEIRDQIEKKYRHGFAIPTVYRILGDRDAFQNDSEGNWSLKK